jgi:hypothetical protein
VRGFLGQVCAYGEREQVAPARVRFAGRAARGSVSRVVCSLKFFHSHALLNQLVSDAVHDHPHPAPVTLRACRDVLCVEPRTVERERDRVLGTDDLCKRGAQLVRLFWGLESALNA